MAVQYIFLMDVSVLALSFLPPSTAFLWQVFCTNHNNSLDEPILSPVQYVTVVAEHEPGSSAAASCYSKAVDPFPLLWPVRPIINIRRWSAHRAGMYVAIVCCTAYVSGNILLMMLCCIFITRGKRATNGAVARYPYQLCMWKSLSLCYGMIGSSVVGGAADAWVDSTQEAFLVVVAEDSTADG